MSYRTHFAEHLRLTLLRLLDAASACTLNDSLLRDAAASYGINASRDQVRQELAWLEQAGLITMQDLSVLKIATLTERGCEVAAGRERVPGVQRPTPGS